MSITFNQPTTAAAERIISNAADGVMYLIHGIRRRIAMRRNRHILHELPDYILRDIGISRAEINAIVRMGNSDTSRHHHHHHGYRDGRPYL